jgi:hypothetical protein
MHPQELKTKCLELAIEAGAVTNTTHTAQKYYDFITGTNDTKILDAARALSEVVNAK